MVREGSWSLDEAPAPARAEVVESDTEYVYDPLFTWSRGALEVSIAAGLLLAAAILTVIAGAMSWGDVGGDGLSISIGLKEVGLNFDGRGAAFDWSHRLFDDLEGIGQVRLASTLHTVGLISTFVSMGIVTTSIFLRTVTLTGLGSVLSVIAVLLTLVATAMFPAGADTAWDDLTSGDQFDGQEVPSDINWKAGPIIAWIGITLGLAGIALGFAATRHDDVS